MSEIERMSEQLKCSFYKGAWHGPSLLEALEGVTAKQALKRPIANAHTIWELVLHAAVWIKAVDKTIADMEYTQVTAEMNWPNINDQSEDSWNDAIAALKRTHKKLERHLSTLKDAALEKIPANTNSTIYRLLHGVIQHNTYHAGQISILNKAK